LGRILGAPFKPFGGLPQMISLAVGIVSLAAAISGAAWVWVTGILPVPWLIVAVLFILLAYFILVVLLQARKEFHKPWFEISDLQIEDDIQLQLFFVKVTNGPVDSWVKGYVGPFDDPRGGAHTQRSWEGHWRAEGPEFDGKLRGGEPPRGYGLVLVRKNPSGSNHPALIVYTREQVDWLLAIPLSPSSQHRGLIISKDVELKEQGIITLDLYMTCSDMEGNIAREIRRSYGIVPDPGSHIGYKILLHLPMPPESPPSCWLCEKSEGIHRIWKAFWEGSKAALKATRKGKCKTTTTQKTGLSPSS
jgi:hypothetical protein